MLIATYFKRPDTAIEMPNPDGPATSYFFRPVDPTNPDSEHVAEVTNPAHLQRFLSITEAYYPAQSQAVIAAAENAASLTFKPVAPRAPAQQEPAPPVPPATVETPAPAEPPADTSPSTDEPPQGDDAGDVEEQPPQPSGAAQAAQELLGLTLSKLRAALPTTPDDVVAAALEIETGKGADERATVSAALRKRLGTK